MSIIAVGVAAESFHYDTETGTGTIDWRSSSPPWDVALTALDDHFLGARLAAPLKKPWLDVYDNVQQHASPGSVHAVHAESLPDWAAVASACTANAAKSLARPINFKGVQVCQGGGAKLPCSKSIPVYQWEPQHEFRGLRHLITYRRFGWPSDKFLAECAVSRVVHEPTLYDGKSDNQRLYGWPLLLLAESLSDLLGQTADVASAITHIIDILWVKHGENWLTLNYAAGADHGHLPVCSWQHAVLVKALGRLVRRGWPDQRAAWLYKAGLKGLDAMHQPDTFSWVKDWDPATGATLAAESLYAGTSLWTACAYAESLSVVTAASDIRREYIKNFIAHSDALKPTDKNFDPAAYALLSALV